MAALFYAVDMQPQKIAADIVSLFLSCDQPGLVFWRLGEYWCLACSPFAQSINDQKQMRKIIDSSASLAPSENICPLALPFGFGLISYDVGVENLGITTPHDTKTPLLQWNVYDALCWGKAGAEESFFIGNSTIFEQLKKSSKPLSKNYTISDFGPLHSEEIWQNGFHKVQQNILAGEIYQLNLGRQFVADIAGDSRQIFWELFARNPAPYAAFMAGSDWDILSMSPELFLHFAEERRVITEPIKGTCKRGKNALEDRQKSQQLLASEKESAELLMITDLLRNDLSQTCAAGSVHVETLRALQQNPTVWHTYSRILGTRRTDCSVADTLFSCLPGGSISGCPKKRACEIIAEIEPHSRGIFCGSIGYLDASGKGEFSILIRTLLRKNKQLYFQAAGGITAYSMIEREAEELFEKGAAFFNLSNSKDV